MQRGEKHRVHRDQNNRRDADGENHLNQRERVLIVRFNFHFLLLRIHCRRRRRRRRLRLRLLICQRAQTHRIIFALRGKGHFRRQQLHRIFRPGCARQFPLKIQNAFRNRAALVAARPIRRHQTLAQNSVGHARRHAFSRGNFTRKTRNVQRFHRRRNDDGQKQQRRQNFRERERPAAALRRAFFIGRRC